jgi:hypothetical protein
MLTIESDLRSEWRPIIKGIAFTILRKLQLSLECLDLFPTLENGLLLFWEVNRHDSDAVGGSKICCLNHGGEIQRKHVRRRKKFEDCCSEFQGDSLDC